MDGKPWRVWLRVGLGVVCVGLVVAFVLGLIVEAVILLATVAACSASLLPLFVDPAVVNTRARQPSASSTRVTRALSGAVVAGRRR